MSLARPELIPTLAGSGKKVLAKHRQSSQSYLAGGIGSGLVGRTFNAFPSLVTDKQIKKLKAIISSIVKLEQSPDGSFHLVSPEDKKAIQKWYRSVASDACSQMLDGYGQIKWSLIDLLGWENYESCYLAEGINQLIYSFVHTVFQQASQRNDDVIKPKPFEYSALGIYFNSIAKELSIQVKKKTQIADERTRGAILKCLVLDYQWTVQRIEDNSNFLAKLFSTDQDKERKIEKKMIALCLADKTTELSHLFIKMRLNCEEQGISSGPLARVVKHYTNKLFSFKLNTKPSTLKVTQRLENSLHPNETKQVQTMPPTDLAGQLASRPGSPQSQEAAESNEEDTYVVIKSEEAKESESYKMTRLAWWMSFFINPRLADTSYDSPHLQEKKPSSTLSA